MGTDVRAVREGQPGLDRRNAEFWEEICGSGLARSLGIRDRSRESLRRFDEAYLAFYPYLRRYVDREELAGRRVLEIGLGYGTLGEVLASRAGEYWGVDVARGPLALMRYRLEGLGFGKRARVVRGSALALPFAGGSFDHLYAIGCLHHVGDLPRAVGEVHRVLAAGGRAVVMLYNRHSFERVVVIPLLRILAALSGRRVRDPAAWIRGRYDRDGSGAVAPHTDFVSRREVRALFGAFRDVRVESRNFRSYSTLGGRLVVPRGPLLGNLARVLGLDLYVTATK